MSVKIEDDDQPFVEAGSRKKKRRRVRSTEQQRDQQVNVQPSYAGAVRSGRPLIIGKLSNIPKTVKRVRSRLSRRMK